MHSRNGEGGRLVELGDYPINEETSMTLPDPSGSPVPVKRGSRLLRTLERCVIGFVSGSIFLLVSAAIFVPTMGGRRSVRLKWNERQQQHNEEIEKAVRVEHVEQR